MALMRSAYIDFISVMMFCIEKNCDPTYEMLTDSELIEKLRKRPWSEYATNVGEQFEKEL